MKYVECAESAIHVLRSDRGILGLEMVGEGRTVLLTTEEVAAFIEELQKWVDEQEDLICCEADDE